MEIDWECWERLIAERGAEIDRPSGSDHPRYPGWRYPLDYGFIPGTVGACDLLAGDMPVEIVWRS